MIIDCQGFATGKFYIPSFTMIDGDIIVLRLFGGAHFYELSDYLAAVFCGKVENPGVIITKPTALARHFKEPTLSRLLNPITVENYIEQHAGLDRKIIAKVIAGAEFNLLDYVNMLNAGNQKLLDLSIALSHSKYVVFDLLGINECYATRIYGLIMQNSRNGGAAILLENAGGFEGACTKLIDVKIIQNI